MSLHATAPIDVSADVSLRVPRGGSETLEAGVESVLAAVDGVDDVTTVRVTSVRPTWTDIRVDADVALSLRVTDASDPEDASVALLHDGFGITAVNDLSVDSEV